MITMIEISKQQDGHVIKRGSLNLVDLSGSENYTRAGAIRARQREAAHIGRGLLALGRVIHALVSDATHIPYRESKLTRLLQDSFGGNSITTLILTVSPSHTTLDESLNTLNYANLARQVCNRPKAHQIAAGRIPEDEDVPATEAVVPVRPWESSIPVRRVRKTPPIDQAAEYHMPTMEWKANTLCNRGENLGKRALGAVK